MPQVSEPDIASVSKCYGSACISNARGTFSPTAHGAGKRIPRLGTVRGYDGAGEENGREKRRKRCGLRCPSPHWGRIAKVHILYHPGHEPVAAAGRRLLLTPAMEL